MFVSAYYTTQPQNGHFVRGSAQKVGYKNEQAGFFLSGDQDQVGSTMRVMRRQIVFFFPSLRAQRVIYTFPRGKEKLNQEIPDHMHHTSRFSD